MDDLDRKILSLLAKNARMPVKEIAEQVALTSPAVSSRIHKLETDGIISGYTVVLNRPADRVYLNDIKCNNDLCPESLGFFSRRLRDFFVLLKKEGSNRQDRLHCFIFLL